MSNKSVSTPAVAIPFGPLPKQSSTETPQNSISVGGIAPRKRGPAGRETTHPIVISYPRRAIPQSDAVTVAGQGSSTSRPSSNIFMTHHLNAESKTEGSRLLDSMNDAPSISKTADSSVFKQTFDVDKQQKVC